MGDRISTPLDPENYSGFYKRSSPLVQEELEKLKERHIKYCAPAQKEKICNELDTDKKHHTLVKLCAKSFAQTELSESSGYEFYFAEPLVEFGPEGKGNHSFDLFLYNEQENRGIFVECKSSITEGKKTIREVQKSREFVLEKIEYLSEIVGAPLDPERIEYVLCIYDKDSSKIIGSIRGQSQSKKPKYDVHLIKLWIYRPRSEIIQLYSEHTHENQVLTELLLGGFGKDQLKRQFELPYCITTHPFRIIILAIITGCYLVNLYNNGGKDPKIIKIKDIFETMMQNISLGVSVELKRRMVKEKLATVIEYGVKYQLFEKIDKDHIRLTCRGTKINVVFENIRDKFVEQWVKEKSEEEAEKLALNEFRKTGLMNQKTLFEKFDSTEKK